MGDEFHSRVKVSNLSYGGALQYKGKKQLIYMGQE